MLIIVCLQLQIEIETLKNAMDQDKSNSQKMVSKTNSFLYLLHTVVSTVYVTYQLFYCQIVHTQSVHCACILGRGCNVMYILSVFVYSFLGQCFYVPTEKSGTYRFAIVRLSVRLKILSIFPKV